MVPLHVFNIAAVVADEVVMPHVFRIKSRGAAQLVVQLDQFGVKPTYWNTVGWGLCIVTTTTCFGGETENL